MDQNIDIIENLQNDYIKQEKIVHNMNSLNKFIQLNKEIIMYVNIRSINANYEKLQVLIESLDVKPFVIVCTETRILEYSGYFCLRGYKLYYNNSQINIADGVVIYIKDHIAETTNKINIGRLSILNSAINIDDKNTLEISSLYRCHDLPCKEFIREFKKYLDTKKIRKII